MRSLRHPAIAFDNQIAQTYRIAPKSKYTSQTFQRPEFFLANKAGEYFTKVERDILDRENILKVMMIMSLLLVMMMMMFTCSTVVVVTEGAV